MRHPTAARRKTGVKTKRQKTNGQSRYIVFARWNDRSTRRRWTRRGQKTAAPIRPSATADTPPQVLRVGRNRLLDARLRVVELRAELVEMAAERLARARYLRSDDIRSWIHSFVSLMLATVCSGTAETVRARVRADRIAMAATIPSRTAIPR